MQCRSKTRDSTTKLIATLIIGQLIYANCYLRFVSNSKQSKRQQRIFFKIFSLRVRTLYTYIILVHGCILHALLQKTTNGNITKLNIEILKMQKMTSVPNRRPTAASAANLSYWFAYLLDLVC
jgi:hypothetical protein